MNPTKLLGIVLLLICSTVHAATFYVSPGGSDSAAGSIAAPFRSFAGSYARMRGGDTLLVMDGTFADPVINGTVRPPSGSAGAPTIVRAVNFGKAIVTGAGVRMEGPPASSLRYVDLDGLLFLKSAGSQLYGVDHIRFFRCGFEDGSGSNNMTFNLHRDCNFILVEDCFAWGSGRYKFSTYHASNVIFRRCVARQDRYTEGGQPIAVVTIYATENCEVQNCISIDGDQGSFWRNPTEYGGQFSVSSTDGPAINNFFRGCIAVNTDLAFTVLAKNLTNVQFENCAAWHVREGGWLRDSATWKKMTLGDFYGPARSTVDANGVGMRFEIGDDPVNSNVMTGSILTRIKGTALTNFNAESNNQFFGNTKDRAQTPIGAGSVNSDPQVKFILRAPGTFGATIEKRIGVSGTFYGESGYSQVTGESLWPWPNEAVIGAAMRNYSYQTLTGNRGFARDGESLTNYLWNYLGNGNPYAGVTPPATQPTTTPTTTPTTVPTTTPATQPAAATQPDPRIAQLEAQVATLQAQLIAAQQSLTDSNASLASTQTVVLQLRAKMANAVAQLEAVKAGLTP